MPFAVSPFPPASQRTIPGFVQHATRQEKQHWCWAAVCSACSHVVGSDPRSQQMIASQVLGQTPPPDDDRELAYALGRANLDAEPISGFPPDRGEIFDALNANHPVAMTIQLDGNDIGHAICAYGYQTVGGLPALWVYDPLAPDIDNDYVRTLTFAALEGGAGLRWVDAFRVRGDV